MKSSYEKLYNKTFGKIKELTIIRIQRNSKKPLGAWGKIKQTNFDELKEYTGNIAILFNPESKYKYGFIDIDGFKKDLKEEENIEFKKELYNLLKSNKELYNHSIIQKTQSGGYHFIFKHNETDKINNRYMNGFKIPEELKEKYNLQKHDTLGIGGNSGAIEIFINEARYCLVYPSRIEPNKQYEIIHVGKEFSKPLKNVKEQLKKIFGDNKKTIKEDKDKNKVKKENNKNNTEFKKEFIKDSELKEKFLNDDKLQELLVKEFKNQTGNHNRIIGDITRVSKYIGLTDDEAVNYMTDILIEADDYTTEHATQVQGYLNTNKMTKPNVKEYFQSEELIEKLKTYINKKVVSYIPTLLNYLEHVNNKGELERKTTLARIELSKVLGEEMNVVRREKIGTTYILHHTTNSYIKIEHDELINLIENRIGRKYLIGDDDLKAAIKHLSKRIKPSFNIIKLNNCLIDMNTVEKIESDKPILCLLDLPYDYNPEAKSEVVDNYLWSSLYDTDDKTTKKKIQGLYELIGYLLTNGNKEEIILFLVGKKGGGKSVMGQMITALVGGGQNTCDVKLDEIGGNDQHATAPFINAHLNLVQEQDKKPIKNTGAIKQASGNDYLEVNPKFKDQVLLEPEEVPKTVVMCNNMPDLTQDTALIDRVITIQFKRSFRNTDEQIKDLGGLITKDKEAMEYILYNSLQAYKPIAQGDKELTLREDEEIRIETINKNAEPIRFYLEQLVEVDEDNDIFDPDYSIGYNDVAIPDLKQLIKIESDKDGVQVDTGKDGLPEARKFKKILGEIFDIDDKEYFNSKGFSREGKLIKYYNHIKFKDGVKNKLKESNNEKNTRIKEDITPIKENTTDMNEIQKQEQLNNDKWILNKKNAHILIDLYEIMYTRNPMTFEEINKEYPYSRHYNDEGEVLSVRKFFKESVKRGLIKVEKDNGIIKYSIDSNKQNNVYCNVIITDTYIPLLDIKKGLDIESLEQYKEGEEVELSIPEVRLLLACQKCRIC